MSRSLHTYPPGLRDGCADLLEAYGSFELYRLQAAACFETQIGSEQQTE
jgi:hypothetical protein